MASTQDGVRLGEADHIRLTRLFPSDCGGGGMATLSSCLAPGLPSKYMLYTLSIL